MSAPAAKRTCYDPITDAELERWPGVTWRRELRGKHQALVLTFGNVSRFVIYPTSPGDSIRGPKNHLANVRQALREMGAARTAEPKGRVARRHRPRVVAPVNLAPSAPQAGASPTRDPWAVLKSVQISEAAPVTPPASPTFWRRIITRLFGVPA